MTCSAGPGIGEVMPGSKAGGDLIGQAALEDSRDYLLAQG